ncbi:hypothetical protein GA0070612_5131 [Micromonospora chokoriensis]|uniref:Uncharacterized protein n=1 Tax=Micromonospora chokoriensis TaxID=356851 RepID=A0A1C4YSJ2_9ACTN|nr:hypothetical protein GA0070612_5131 [Micromonospora chokoriensis]
MWDDAKNFFDPDLMGALPDVRVEDASVEDWQAVFDLVQTQGWKWEYSVGNDLVPLPSAAEVLARPVGAELPIFRVWPVAGVLVNFWPYSAVEIDFDIDVRELQGQQRLDMLCEFFAAIGRRLGKPVLMAPEGDYLHPVLGFDVEADHVVLLGDPRLPGEGGVNGVTHGSPSTGESASSRHPSPS